MTAFSDVITAIDAKNTAHANALDDLKTEFTKALDEKNALGAGGLSAVFDSLIVKINAIDTPEQLNALKAELVGSVKAIPVPVVPPFPGKPAA